jgi:hypothetical protein
MKAFPYLAFVAFFTSTVAEFNLINSFNDFVIVIIYKSFGYIATFTFWNYAANQLKKYGKSKLQLWQIMGIGFLGGVVYFLATGLACWCFGITLTPSPTRRLLGFALQLAFWLPAGSVISRNLDRYQVQKREFRENLLQQESMYLARKSALDQYKLEIEGRIQENLRTTTQNTIQLFNNLKERDVERLPDYLRLLSKQYFQLTARKMERRENFQTDFITKIKRRTVSLVGTFRESVLTRPLNPTWFAIIVSVTLIVPLERRTNETLVFETIFIVGVSSFIIQRFALYIFQFLKKPFVISLLIVLSTAANILIPLSIVNSLPFNTLHKPNVGAFVMMIVATVFLGHLAQAGLLKREDFKDYSVAELTRIRSHEVEETLLFAKITRDWAKYIHGSFTTKLESSALALETALTKHDFEAAEKAIRQVEHLLSAENYTLGAPQEILLDEVHERCRLWEGIVDISIESHISSQVQVQVSIRDVGICIEEAILNATRHGDCTKISIDLFDSQDHFLINIRDNGVGLSQSTSGFGSTIFSDATQNNWKISRDKQFQLTVLELNFPKIR